VNRCVRSWFLAILLAPCASLVVRGADAAPKDAAATKLADDAINSDYLATKFADAQKKLDKAIKLCAGAACSPQVKARLHRDLGVVLIAGLNKTQEGQAAFVEALRLDPKAQLVKDFVTPEIDKAWQAAKGGAPAAAAPAAEEPAEEPAAPAPKAQPSGDLIHTPPVEQATLTPVPIYAVLPDGLLASRLVVRYKPFGQTEWKSIDMRRVSKGYGIDLPCMDVGEVAGDLSYYIQALDEKGELIGSSGSRTQPFKVPIKNQLSGDQPHLPGQPPAARCQSTTDCPPGFPGCKGKGKKGGKAWGSGCDMDTECAEGLICKGGQCDTGGPAAACDADADCDGTKCVDHACEVAAPALKRNLLSFNVQADLSILSGESDVCAVNHANRFYCVAIDGYEYAGIPDTAAGSGDTIKGGFGVASFRPMVGFDRVLGDNFTLGARLGYGFRLQSGGPKDYFPAHLEGRFAYFLGRAPFQKTRVRPFAALLVGATEFDTKVDVPVIETDPIATDYPKTNNHGAYRDAGGQGQTLTVWRRSRTAFAGLAVGTMIPVGGPTSGFLFELKYMFSFPDPGMILSPSLGYVIGL
jgi:hypothetical protein